MTLVVEGILGVEQMLLNLDTQGRKRVVKSLYAQALKLRDLARKFAPVDDGNLEKAILIHPERLEGAIRDERGRFARQEIEVYIDMEMPVPERPGKTVGDYAYVVHEHVTPYGPKNLGPLSELKQAGQSEIVGGGFLERAAEEIEEQLDDVLLDILHDL